MRLSGLVDVAWSTGLVGEYATLLDSTGSVPSRHCSRFNSPLDRRIVGFGRVLLYVAVLGGTDGAICLFIADRRVRGRDGVTWEDDAVSIVESWYIVAICWSCRESICDPLKTKLLSYVNWLYLALGGNKIEEMHNIDPSRLSYTPAGLYCAKFATRNGRNRVQQCSRKACDSRWGCWVVRESYASRC